MNTQYGPPAINLSEIMIKCYKLSQVIKLFTLLDLLFSFILVKPSIYYIVNSTLKCVGYFGAERYNRVLTLFYFIFIFTSSITRILVTVHFYVMLSHPHKHAYIPTVIFTIINTFIGLWFSRIIYRFYRVMGRLTPPELNEVRVIRLHFIG